MSEHPQSKLTFTYAFSSSKIILLLDIQSLLVLNLDEKNTEKQFKLFLSSSFLSCPSYSYVYIKAARTAQKRARKIAKSAVPVACSFWFLNMFCWDVSVLPPSSLWFQRLRTHSRLPASERTLHFTPSSRLHFEAEISKRGDTFIWLSVAQVANSLDLLVGEEELLWLSKCSQTYVSFSIVFIVWRIK